MSKWRGEPDPVWKRPFPATCTEEDVYYCFRLLLGRSPSPTEWSGHCGRIGHELRQVVAEYLSSREFKDRGLLAAPAGNYVLVNLSGFDLWVPADDAAVGRHVLHGKAYEPHVTAAIERALRPGMTFVDIGANIGFFTMLGARIVGAGGRVFACEPFQSNLKLLYLSTRANRFDHIAILPFAASDQSGLVAFDNVASNGQISALRADLSFLLSTTLVYAARLDDVLRDVARVDAIKIDVEGAEHRALLGGWDLLARSKPTIFSEFAPPALAAVSGVDAETYLRLLLLDERYVLDVLNVDGSVIECGRDLGRLIRSFERSGVDHIDIAARPVS